MPPQPKEAWADEENDQEIEEDNKADDDFDEESISERQEIENEIGQDNGQGKSDHNNNEKRNPITGKFHDPKNKSNHEEEQVNGFMTTKPSAGNFAS